MNFVDQIYSFNSQAGLLGKPYNDLLESSFQIEEALEGFDLRKLWSKLNGFSRDATAVALQTEELQSTLKARDIARDILYDFIATDSSLDALRADYLSDVERLDKACDAIVFAFGSIFKLGLNPEQAARAVSIVMSANLAKLSMPKDEFGKLTKPTDFVGPEAQLEELLNERPVR